MKRPSNSVQVSPRHHVLIDESYLPMIERAPREDFVIRTLTKRMAGNMPLMSGDLVIAGARTREAYPLAARYPLHFRKTYYPGRLHGDPCLEFDRHAQASQIIALPAPIGCSRTTFRSCFLPGTPLHRFSGLGSEPPASNIAHAQGLPGASLAGLWHLAHSAYSLVCALQEAGLSHGDAHLHNFIVCPSPLQVLPVDFEIATVREDYEAAQWTAHCDDERQYILQLAVYLQCALGRQSGPMAEEALRRLDTLVSPAETFRRAITERTYGDFT